VHKKYREIGTKKKMYLGKKPINLLLMLYMSRNFSVKNSLAECNWKALAVFTGSRMKTSPAKVMHHAGVAVKLFCLKLRIMGQLCMLKEFITYILTEYTRDFVLDRTGNICPDIIVYHAGVAVKETMWLVRIQHVQFISPFYNLKVVTECILNNFGSNEDLLVKRRSNDKVERHAGVAVKPAFKKKMNKNNDRKKQKKELEERAEVKLLSCFGSVTAMLTV